MQAFRDSADPATARVKSLEARLAQESQRGLQLEKQMQAFLGRTTHPIAQVRDLEPRIVEQEKPSAVVVSKVVPRVEGKVPRQARRKV